MMKSVGKMLLAVGVFLLSIQLGAYPTMERARALFPLNGSGVLGQHLTDKEKSDFCLELVKGGTIEQKREMESYLIAAITTSVIRADICTNRVKRIVDNYAGGFFVVATTEILGGMELYKTNTIVCEAIASYISTIKHADIPKELLEDNIPVKRYWKPLGSTGLRIAVPDPDAAMERSRRKHIINCITSANCGIDKARLRIFQGLSSAIVSCYETLPRSEFESFTNRMVKLSQATENERFFLFNDLENLYNYDAYRKRMMNQSGCSEVPPDDDVEVEVDIP